MIKFHYTYIIVALGLVLTGYYLDLIIYTSLILVHELGHYIVAKILNFNVIKIIIYPYGGLTKLDDLINKDINKELLVAVSGILFQLLFFFIIVILYKNNIIRSYTYNLYREYNKVLILFNFLPIYPLDGSKILKLLLEKIIPYKITNYLMIIISIITIISLLIFNIFNGNYSFIMIIIILLNYIYIYYKNLSYLYNRFLLERYLYKIKYNDTVIIKNKNCFYKNKNHIIKNNKKYEKEDYFLYKLFDLNKKIW